MTSAAELLDLQAGVAPPRKYWDKANYASFDEQQAACAVSTTVYVGNLSYYTSEQLVYELARQAGPIKKVSYHGKVVVALNHHDVTNLMTSIGNYGATS